MTEFAAPDTSGGFFQPAEMNGHLLVIEVHSVETEVPTVHGPSDAVKATVHDIDSQMTEEDALIFPKVLFSSLRKQVGHKVLAVLGQGVAKPGQSAPWVLNDASGDPAAAARATAYLAARAQGQFSAPAPGASFTPQPAPAQPATPAQAAQHTAAAAPPQVDLTDPNVVAALAALQAQGLVK